MDDWEFDVLFKSGEGILGIFLFSVATRPAQGPTQFSFSEYKDALSLGSKTLECEAVHLPLSSAKALCRAVPTLWHSAYFKYRDKLIEYSVLFYSSFLCLSFHAS
jgi:hypothetical protein